MSIASAVSFSPDVQFTPDNKLVLTGTVDGDNISGVDILTTSGTDLGLAQVSRGIWTFTESLGTDFSTFQLKADATIAGSKVESDSPDFIVTGVKDSPYTSIVQQQNVIDDTKGTMEFFDRQGNMLLHSTFDLDGPTINNSKYVETGDALKTQFVYISGPGTDTAQTITNFHAAGPEHDTLLMPHADFANLAEVIRNTTMSQGNAVIHDPNGGSTMTLMGVSKAELKSHPHDFSFHGTGQLVPGQN